MELSLVIPDLGIPGIRAACTTRAGGVSTGCYASMNLGLHTGDDPAAVLRNREILRRELGVGQVAYVRQIHGITVAGAAEAAAKEPDHPLEADALICRDRGTAAAVMTADCLPVLLAAGDGSVAAAAHAGWRGLCDGVLENTLAAMDTDPAEIRAWLGPCIGPDSFEVGPEVREAFLRRDPECGDCFRPGNGDRLLASLPALAVRRLLRAGLLRSRISGGDLDTFTSTHRFFSYRRERITGRMASLIWLD